MVRLSVGLAVLMASAACGEDASGVTDAAPHIDGIPRDGAQRTDALAPTCAPVSGTNLALVPAAEGFVDPVLVTSPPGDARLFVVEQSGRILVVEDGRAAPEPFLDIQGPVLDLATEQGLLGLAFHPRWADNGRFFVYYTAVGDSDPDPYLDVVAEYRVARGDPDHADPTSERRLLEVPDPASNHNGGMMAFGPDGMLYIGMGDGGRSGDFYGNGQDKTTLLGDMLRIDVDADDPYGIPADNPYVGSPGGAREEIWLSGVRNPWRWSFDRQTGELYIGDVGQDTVEEVDLVPAGQGGANLGWNHQEGDRCFSSPSCASEGFLDPIATYLHPVPDHCAAIIGGYVYRGACSPDIAGWYFYGDACLEQVWTLQVEAGAVVSGPTEITATLDPGGDLIAGISSFGEDALGEVYLASRRNGIIYRITAGP